MAYRYFATARRKFIIADTPGHEQYTRNMVTGASTAKLAILLVDARHGIVAQTRRHATLAHLLGIPHLVVAVNKMDLVDWRQECFNAIVADFRDFAQRTRHRRRAVSCRFRRSKATWSSIAAIASAGTTAPRCSRLSRRPKSRRRSPAHRSASPSSTSPVRRQRCRAATWAASSRVRRRRRPRRDSAVGDRDDRAQHPDFRGAVTRAGLHASVTFMLGDELDVSRGDMLVGESEAPTATRVVAATLCWLGDAPLDPRRTYLLRHTTREVRARVAHIDHLWNISTQAREPAPARLARNDIGQVTLKLAGPVFADRYAENRATGSFILIDETTNNTIAAGMVVSVEPSRDRPRLHALRLRRRRHRRPDRRRRRLADDAAPRLLFGVSPATAVGTDLLYAAVTKAGGGAVHARRGHVRWDIVARLAAGSISGALLTIAVSVPFKSITPRSRKSSPRRWASR